MKQANFMIVYVKILGFISESKPKAMVWEKNWNSSSFQFNVFPARELEFQLSSPCLHFLLGKVESVASRYELAVVKNVKKKPNFLRRKILIPNIAKSVDIITVIDCKTKRKQQQKMCVLKLYFYFRIFMLLFHSI